MSRFSTLLPNLLSPDSSTRTSAENELSSLIASSPSEAFLELVSSCMNSSPDITKLALVLLKKKFLETDLIRSLPEASRQTARSGLYEVISSKTATYSTKMLANVLTQMASIEGWVNELFTQVNSWLQTADSYFQVLALNVLELSTDFDVLMETMKSNAAGVMSLLGTAFNSQDGEVKILAIKTCVTFLSAMDDETQVLSFSSAAPALLSGIVEGLQNSGNTETVMKTLVSISDLTDTFPRFWASTTQEFVDLTHAIATNTQFDTELRAASVEPLVTLTQRAPGMFKKTPAAIQTAVSLSLALTSEVDFADDLETWNEEDEQEVTQNEPYFLGRDLLSKMAVSLEGKAILPYLLGSLPNMLKSESWVTVHTALLTIGCIAEGCHDEFEANLEEIVNMVLPFTTSSSPRLQWASITTLGLLCSEFKPVIQTRFHARLVPALLAAFAAANLTRVKTQGASAIINYSEGLIDEENTDETLSQYATTILENLAGLLQTGVNTSAYGLLEESLKAISVVATAIESKFAPFYPAMMPALKSLVQMNATTPKQQEVRAQAVRCMGYLVESVSELGGDYRVDAKTIMEGLFSLKTALDSEDPAVISIREVLSSFASCLKEEFSTALTHFLPELFTLATTLVDMKFGDLEETGNLAPGENAVKFDLGGHGSKQLTVNTTALQNKISAVKVLYDIIISMKQAYAPFTEKTLEVLTTLTNYGFNSEIRKYSLYSIGELVANSTNSEAALVSVFRTYCESLKTSTNLPPRQTKWILRSLLTALEASNSVAFLGLAQANELATILSERVRDVFNRKVTRQTEAQGYKDTELYAEELKELKQDDELDNKILNLVMEIVGKLLKSFRKEFQPTFTSCFTRLYSELLTKPHATDVEKLSAICIFDDYIEFTQDLMFDNGKSPIVDQLLAYSSHSNADIRQSAVYGLGVSADLTESAVFQPYLEPALKSISDILTAQNARSEENTVATDCAVGALGKIALKHRSDLVHTWLTHMPIQQEPEESQMVNKLFLKNLSLVQADSEARRVLADLEKLVRESPNAKVLDQEGITLLGAALGN